MKLLIIALLVLASSYFTNAAVLEGCPSGNAGNVVPSDEIKLYKMKTGQFDTSGQICTLTFKNTAAISIAITITKNQKRSSLANVLGTGFTDQDGTDDKHGTYVNEGATEVTLLQKYQASASDPNEFFSHKGCTSTVQVPKDLMFPIRPLNDPGTPANLVGKSGSGGSCKIEFTAKESGHAIAINRAGINYANADKASFFYKLSDSTVASENGQELWNKDDIKPSAKTLVTGDTKVGLEFKYGTAASTGAGTTVFKIFTVDKKIKIGQHDVKLNGSLVEFKTNEDSTENLVEEGAVYFAINKPADYGFIHIKKFDFKTLTNKVSVNGFGGAAAVENKEELTADAYLLVDKAKDDQYIKVLYVKTKNAGKLEFYASLFCGQSITLSENQVFETPMVPDATKFFIPKIGFVLDKCEVTLKPKDDKKMFEIQLADLKMPNKAEPCVKDYLSISNINNKDTKVICDQAKWGDASTKMKAWPDTKMTLKISAVTTEATFKLTLNLIDNANTMTTGSANSTTVAATQSGTSAVASMTIVTGFLAIVAAALF